MEPCSSTNQSSTMVTDLDVDTLVQCANYLDLQDLSNMAMSCKFFKNVAYSDVIWQRWYREHWPQLMASSLLRTSGARIAYLDRRTALRQFKFVDPSSTHFYSPLRPYNHILVDKSDIILSQGSVIQMARAGKDSLLTLGNHSARITCMRLFSLDERYVYRRGARKRENVLVTSSCDRSIRLWWKDGSQRSFKGHNGPVTTLSDKLLGDYSGGEVLASGGEDGTVRLWSLTTSGKRGQHALRTTFHGHEKPVTLLSVAGHKTSLLVSISKDAKVRVWDATISSAARSSGCVGMTSVLGPPVGVKCHESLCYIAAGASVTTIDLRTMQKVSTAATHQRKIYSLEMLPSKSLICTGGYNKAMVWDIRKTQEKPKPLAELDGHTGCISLLHMDSYKIVTGGPEDSYINVWETNTGTQTNSFTCCIPDELDSILGYSAMCVNGFRIVTATDGPNPGLVCVRDFSNAISPVPSHDDNTSSKFWETQ